MPVVLNKKIHGIPEGSTYVGRPSLFRNPYMIGKDGNREEVIAKFLAMFRENRALQKQAKLQLSGKDLVCWCAPKTCHADILLKFVQKGSF